MLLVAGSPSTGSCDAREPKARDTHVSAPHTLAQLAEMRVSNGVPAAAMSEGGAHWGCGAGGKGLIDDHARASTLRPSGPPTPDATRATAPPLGSPQGGGWRPNLSAMPKVPVAPMRKDTTSLGATSSLKAADIKCLGTKRPVLSSPRALGIGGETVLAMTSTPPNHLRRNHRQPRRNRKAP